MRCIDIGLSGPSELCFGSVVKISTMFILKSLKCCKLLSLSLQDRLPNEVKSDNMEAGEQTERQKENVFAKGLMVTGRH